MSATTIIRIQRAAIRNFRNVEFGEIRFPCNYEENVFAPRADVLGIYGQNGSGKTTFIDALEILRTLLSGQKIGVDLPECITYGHDMAELSFEFSLLDMVDNRPCGERTFIYSAVLGKDFIDETVKCSTFVEGKSSRLNTAFVCTHNEQDGVFSPKTKLEALFGTKQNQIVDELRVTKLLCQRERRSFLFSQEFITMLSKAAKGFDEESSALLAMAFYAKTSFFVITNRNNGLITLDAALPFNFRTETAGGIFALSIDKPTIIKADTLRTVSQVIMAINAVLGKIVPHASLTLVELGKELLADGTQGVKIQLARDVEDKNGERHALPLKYESEGIKKIISILHLLIAAYNNPSITLAIDELDSGIYEYLLGELLRIMQNSGKGQLIFTSHNLYPLETLRSNSIVFTTTSPECRYTRIGSVRATNNLRSMYLREVILGSDSKRSLYEDTNESEIAHAMRAAGYTAWQPPRGEQDNAAEDANA